MIQITYERPALRLTVTGHSGADVPGRDIVCAGVSALVCTLAAAVNGLELRGVLESSRVRLCPGEAVIQCEPREGFGCLVRTVMDSLVLGLERLGEEYPEYVTFRSGELR